MSKNERMATQTALRLLVGGVTSLATLFLTGVALRTLWPVPENWHDWLAQCTALGIVAWEALLFAGSTLWLLWELVNGVPQCFATEGETDDVHCVLGGWAWRWPLVMATAIPLTHLALWLMPETLRLPLLAMGFVYYAHLASLLL